jgi:hypothetical protein
MKSAIQSHEVYKNYIISEYLVNVTLRHYQVNKPAQSMLQQDACKPCCVEQQAPLVMLLEAAFLHAAAVACIRHEATLEQTVVALDHGSATIYSNRCILNS